MPSSTTAIIPMFQAASVLLRQRLELECRTGTEKFSVGVASSRVAFPLFEVGFGGQQRLRENRQKLVGFGPEDARTGFVNGADGNQMAQPELRFVGLLDDRSQLGDELLRRYRQSWNGLEAFAERLHRNREPLCALHEIPGLVQTAEWFHARAASTRHAAQKSPRSRHPRQNQRGFCSRTRVEITQLLKHSPRA